MNPDVELFRDLLFVLETCQTSPRSTVIISIDAEADGLGCVPEAIEAGLAALLDYEYIDGPGLDAPGFFLFRKLTRKGVQFVRETRDPRDWERMKRHFAGERFAGAPSPT